MGIPHSPDSNGGETIWLQEVPGESVIAQSRVAKMSQYCVGASVGPGVGASVGPGVGVSVGLGVGDVVGGGVGLDWKFTGPGVGESPSGEHEISSAQGIMYT